MRHLCLGILILVPWIAQALTLNEGGVSGGGGNLIHPTPPKSRVPAELAEHIIERSYSKVRLYLEYKGHQYDAKQLPLAEQQTLEPLLQQRARLFATLEKTPVQIAEEEPCWSPSQAVDGSTFSNIPGGICISAFNISHKVTVQEMPSQAAALLVHEYSENLGLSDAQAVSIQELVLKELQRTQKESQ